MEFVDPAEQFIIFDDERKLDAPRTLEAVRRRVTLTLTLTLTLTRTRTRTLTLTLTRTRCAAASAVSPARRAS